MAEDVGFTFLVPLSSPSALELLVRRQRQEVLELLAQRHAIEQLARLVRAALAVEELVAHLLADLLELLLLVAAHQLRRDLLAGVQGNTVPHPLPHLRAR